MNCHVLALLTIKQSMIWYDMIEDAIITCVGSDECCDRQTQAHCSSVTSYRQAGSYVQLRTAQRRCWETQWTKDQPNSTTLSAPQTAAVPPLSACYTATDTHTWLEKDKQTDVGSSTTHHFSSSTLSLIYSYRHTHVTWDKQTDRHGHNEGCGVSIQ